MARDIYYSAFDEQDCELVRYCKCKVIRVPKDIVHQVRRWFEVRRIDCKVLANDMQTGLTPEDELPRAEALKENKLNYKYAERAYRIKHERRKELF
jgi:hypothetical protein